MSDENLHKVPQSPIKDEGGQRDDPLMGTINKWRWDPVTPCDPDTASRIGGAYFEYLFDGQTAIRPQSPDEETYFNFLSKKFNAKGGPINITADEVAKTLRLLQSATLTKMQIRDGGGKVSIRMASDNALEELYLLLENIPDDNFIRGIDQILGIPQPTTS
ncbi:hypothetical protein HY612_00755 [Candidatus Roizmanbacteria bacterium]|nr:hypothetical protein [Candidatus Roizmanbacteria bacterium]